VLAFGTPVELIVTAPVAPEILILDPATIEVTPELVIVTVFPSALLAVSDKEIPVPATQSTT
jgi:hypothetical protein